MTTGIFLYNSQEGDICFIKKEYAEDFDQNRFLQFVDQETDEEICVPEELPDGQFDEYIRIAEDGIWYQVVAMCVAVSDDFEILGIDDEEDFDFLYALQPIDDDISEMLDSMLDLEHD